MIFDVYVLQILYAALDLRLFELPGFVLGTALITITLLMSRLRIYNKQLTRSEGGLV